jgi:hypothetical protein
VSQSVNEALAHRAAVNARKAEHPAPDPRDEVLRIAQEALENIANTTNIPSRNVAMDALDVIVKKLAAVSGEEPRVATPPSKFEDELRRAVSFVRRRSR